MMNELGLRRTSCREIVMAIAAWSRRHLLLCETLYDTGGCRKLFSVIFRIFCLLSDRVCLFGSLNRRQPQLFCECLPTFFNFMQHIHAVIESN